MHAGLASVVLVCTFQSNVDREIDVIVARAAMPQEGDQRRIKELGDAAFLKLYSIADRNKQKDFSSASETQLTYLVACAGPSRTLEMSKLFRESPDSYRSYLFDWLANVGEPSANRDLFESELTRPTMYRWSSTAVCGLARIGDQRAIDLLVQTIKDPTTAREVRRTIACKLNALPSASGRAAVRAVMAKGRKVPSLLDRTRLAPKVDGPKFELSSSTDSRGVTWGLVHWDALGSPNDLWVVRLSHGKWVDPIFTGVSDYWPAPRWPGSNGSAEHKKQMKALIEDKGWVKRFVGNAALAKDTDGDGLTDVAERWLGLDSNKMDSDEDGLPDGVDKNPLAAPHSLSDADKAMQAVLNLFCLSDTKPNVNHVIGLPLGVRPFEIESCNGPVYTREAPTGLSEATGKISAYRFSVNKARRSSPNEIVVSACESGGFYELLMDVTVRKIDGEWLCVDVRQTAGMVS
jgi:hypothetical protein